MRVVIILFLFAFSFSLYSQEDNVRVMSFNIRLPVANDGINYWDHRRELVKTLVLYHEPDLIGVQEAFRRQLDEMTTDMPQYAWTGICRTDGTVNPSPDSEFSAILYRKVRFELLESNTFWLSPTPSTVGSIGWDAAFPRIVTWAKFKDRKTNQLFYHFNTHFDHIGTEAQCSQNK